jgi:hypothetical protein
MMAAMRHAVLVGLAAVAACSPTARSVRRDETLRPGQGDGIVIGKVGFASRTGDPILMATFIAIDERGKKWTVRLEDGLVEDHGQSAPFFAVLPPGRYTLGRLELDFTDTSWSMDDMGLVLEVAPGGLSCAGAAYLRARAAVDDSTGGNSTLRAAFDVRDECAHLAALLRQQAPFLAAPPRVTLARPR